MTGSEERRVYVWEGPPRLELFRGEGRSSDGRVFGYHRLVAGRGIPGAVVVAERGEALCMVRMLRPGTARPCLELPRGFGDSGDAGDASDAAPGAAVQSIEAMALAAGGREFLEETGFRLDGARLLGTIAVDSSLYPQPVGVVHGLTTGVEAGARDGEIEDVAWVDGCDLDALIAAGTIRDAISLAAITLWRAARGAHPASSRRGGD